MGSLAPSSREFDFIVLGGGTAGNVVAGRSAENLDVSVLVVEAGPTTPYQEPMITTPARAFELRNIKYDWGYRATMINRPDYERVEKPHTRGKVLGGCSYLNYYTWPANYHDDSHIYSLRLAKVGHKGPLDVAINDMVPELETFRSALTSAWVSKGEELAENIYEGRQRGLVKCMSTIYKGQRSTSAVFVLGKPNITILCETQTKKIIIENGVAVGAEVISTSTGEEFVLRASKEIILSCGVFESPKILMLSGVGQPEQLAAFGIDSKVNSPNVGANLLDHPILPHVFKLKDGCGLDGHLLRAGPAKEAAVRAYQRDRTGPLHSGLLELVAFPRIDKRLMANKAYRAAKEANGNVDPFGPDEQPHFEIDFVPMFYDAFQWHIPTPSTGSHLTVIVDLLRPVSTPGYIKLTLSSHTEPPSINLNFFSSSLDLLALREGVRFIDDILTTGTAMKDITSEDYPWPMPRESDEAIERMILERSQTGFHPCGTNRMGKNVEMGVVARKLRVFGTERLRVVDASVFPVIPDSRIQNAVYMVGEKGADIDKEAYPELYGKAG